MSYVTIKQNTEIFSMLIKQSDFKLAKGKSIRKIGKFCPKVLKL